MDILEQYVEDNLLSKEKVLDLIDDYSIYCYYLGFNVELKTRYSSPLRPGDENPSFVLFRIDDGTILFKDHAAATYVGDVFKFLGLYLSINKTQVLEQINSDLNLGLQGQKVDARAPRIAKIPVLEKEQSKLEVTSKKNFSVKLLKFFGLFGITENTLLLYNVTEVDVLHVKTETKHSVIIPKSLCIAYRIFDCYKIYQPFDKLHKFLTDYEPSFVEGAEQLTYENNFCILTKATKEIMFFRENFNFDAIAGKSENTPVPDYFLNTHVFPKYKRVFIALDQDEAGRKAQAHYLSKYPALIPITFESDLGLKDLTDHYAASLDKKAALLWIKTLFKHE